MDWFDLLNTQEPGTFELSDPRSQDMGYGFDAVNLSPGEGNLEQDYYVTDRGGVNTSYGEMFRPPTTGGSSANLGRLLERLKNFGSKAGNFATSNQGIMAILAALAAAADRQKPSGGGTRMAYAGPTPVTRTMTQGKYGPIARYAANGGLMQAYAQGGQVQMEDGGFVMTKKAVDGAGGPRGLASLVPGARMIGGPPDPTGRKDLTSAVIHGPNGQTPAKVSRGEAYVPKRVVNQNGGSQKMYALMNSLQRRA
jgi:hypothetical protein